jgi:MFS family permease
MTTPPTIPLLFRELASIVGPHYFPLAFIGRLPFAMMIVGVLTVTTVEQRSLTLAGVLAAAAGLGTASLGPLSGSFADRYGQRRVLLILGVASSLATGGFLALVRLDAPAAVLIASACILGATTPQVAPFSRARLVGAAVSIPHPASTRAQSVVMSYESMADEASFVLGPVLVGALSAGIAPWAPLALSAALTVTVVTAFALHPTASLAHAGAEARSTSIRTPLGSLVTIELATLVLAMIAVGGVFGSLLTGLTGLMQQLGAVEQTGLLYGAMSVGAIVTALAFMALPARYSLSLRWLTGSAMAIAAIAALAVSDEIAIVALALFVAGCGVGASLVSLFSLGAIAAPPDRTNTVLVTLQSSLVVGQAVLTAICGSIAESMGPTAVFMVGAALALALLGLAVTYRFGTRPGGSAPLDSPR